MSYRENNPLVRVLAIAAVAVATATVVSVAQAATTSPSSPSSYAAQPEPEQEETNQGSWQWVLTTPQNPSAMKQPTAVPDHAGTIVVFYPPDPFPVTDGSYQSQAPGGTNWANLSGVSVEISGSGKMGNDWVLFKTGWSIGGHSTGSFDVVYTREWVDGYDNDGDSAPQKHLATASSGGNADEVTIASAGAYSGSGANVTATMSGSCSGLTSAGGADMSGQTSKASAQYTTIGNSVSGNIGAAVPSSPGLNVSGSFDTQITQQGNGNNTGGASYNVKNVPDSLDSSEAGITVSASGNAGAIASGSGSEPGNASLDVSSTVQFTETASG